MDLFFSPDPVPTMNVRLSLLILFVIGAFAPLVGAEDRPHRTGWAVGVGPRIQWLSDHGHDVLTNRYVRGRGIGGEIRLSYGFTEHWEGRIAVSTNRQSSREGTAGVAWAAADLLFRQPVGRFDPVLFARFGKQALALDGAIPDELGEPSDHTWTGLVGGAGGGVRYWITPHLSLSGEAAYTYVRYSHTVVLDGTGTPMPLNRATGATAWGLTLVAVEYHW